MKGDKNFVCECPFRDGADGFAGMQRSAGLRRRCELPLLFGVQRFRINAALQKPAGLFRQGGKRILKSVVDLPEKAGAQFGRQHFSGKLDLIPAFDAAGHLIYLNLRDFAADTDDLAFQRSAIHLYKADFIHGNVAVKFDGYQVSVDAYNLSSVFFGHDRTSNRSPFRMEL